MSRRNLTCLVLIAVMLIGVTVAFAAQGKIKWYTDYNQALKAAQSAKKPMMVDFYADWCGWCKKLDSDTFSNSKVIGQAANFVSVKVNTDKNQALAKKYKVTGLPTIVFMDSNGKEVSRVTGFQGPDQFSKSMQNAMNKAKK